MITAATTKVKEAKGWKTEHYPSLETESLQHWIAESRKNGHVVFAVIDGGKAVSKTAESFSDRVAKYLKSMENNTSG